MMRPATAELTPEQLHSLMVAATSAASSHNTQPWRFHVHGHRISILPDLSRRCPAVDPDDHHLYASLGCAAENLTWAARAAGLQALVSFDATRSAVIVDLDAVSAESTALERAIPARQCSRSMYDGAVLSGKELRQLEAAGQGNGVSMRLITDRRQMDQVADYVAAGKTAQFADPRWRRELQSWVRFDAGEARRRGDGLFGPVMGSPAVPRWVGSLFMRLGFSARRQNRKDVAQIRSSGAVAVFVSEQNDPGSWMEAGRCYERMALQATALDIRSAFINQPVEVAALRGQLATFLGIGTRRPDLVVRLGHGPVMPRSFRRPIESVMVDGPRC
jgi:nitroreductase